MNRNYSNLIRNFARRAFYLALASAGLFTYENVQAQNSTELSATYGRGVHAFFSNQTSLADEYFTRVIQAGTSDPRVYYYRAMTRMRNGHQQEAEDDMRTGAAYEASNPGNRQAIGKALERVQGSNRRLLENFRQQARMDRLQDRRHQTRQRYEQLEDREPVVLRREISVPLEQLIEPTLKLPGQTASPVGSPLPAASVAPASKKPAPDLPSKAKPDPPAGDLSDDIFGEAKAEPSKADPIDEPKPSSESADASDPFGESADKTNPEPKEDDLFADPKPTEEAKEEPASDEDDPFGGFAEETESTPKEEDPFGEAADQSESGTEDSDIFGEPASENKEKESSSEDDPFAEPAEESDPAPVEEEDPFGEPESETEGEETAPEDDPFGESAEEADDSEAEDEDPFGEPESEEKDTEPTEEEDDLFGSIAPKTEPTGQIVAGV